MTHQKQIEVKQRLYAKWVEETSYGNPPNFAMKLARKVLLAELKDEGVTNQLAISMIQEAADEIH